MNIWMLTAFVSMAAVLIVLQQRVDVAIVFILIVVIGICWRSRGKRLYLAMCLLLVYVVFTSSTWLHDRNNVSKLTGTEEHFTFTVSDRFHIDGDRLQGVVQTTGGERLMLRMRLMEKEQQRLSSLYLPGSHCEATGVLIRPNEARNFYAFDYRTYLYMQKIHWQLQVEPQAMTCASGDLLDKGRYLLASWRTMMIETIVADFPSELKGVVLALTFGERRYIEGALLDAYAELGIIHLLAISGLHVGLISAVMYAFLLRVGVTRERAQTFMLCLLPVFAMLTGASPPVVRASAMAFVIFLCIRLRLRTHPLYGIMAIFFAYLLIDPYQLLQLGFQLSFIVSFTLLFAAKTIQTRYKSSLARLFVVSTIAQLVGLPLIFYNFFEWSALSLLLNLVYIPFISLFVLPVSILSVVLFFLFPSLPNIAVFLLESVVPYVHHVVFALQKSSLFTFVLGKPHPLLLVCMYGASYFLLVSWERRHRLWSLSVIPLCLVISIKWLMPYMNPNAEMTMIDVGQGDSFVIEAPFRRHVTVIDTGGTMSFSEEDWQRRQRSFDTGKDQVSAYLKAKGVKTVDRLVLTHGHDDHMGGAKGLIAEMNVREVVYPAVAHEQEKEQVLFADIQQRGIPVRFVQEGDKLVSSGQVMHVLGPPSDVELGLNDGSVVLFMKIEGVSFLFTGDIEEEGERVILEQFPNLTATILKVAHHGSRTSTSEAWLNEVNPKVALVSAGVNNRFGHPHPEVVSRLHEAAVPLYRTDEHGMVVLKLRDRAIVAIESKFSSVDKKSRTR
ncbi:DNA internalization-related competence protein ComEC/Rec2 [Shouchella lonarensis]|uniref:Competence protein ComEC n=1 Tax=Shouchella lonarensis TaxID=1464122 RepID=A0A1G6KGJ8_9BACI|nr:DNA internalization-related competence protein ComEC/Rec2 [Shouchella lonarensis]SDC30093.1 competence protein ComEC [Shouchella lonarensis]